MKRLLIGFFFAVTVLLSAGQAQAVTIVDSAYWAVSGKTYYLLSSTASAGLTWNDAENYAVSNLGGHLATVDSAATQSWIWDEFGGGVSKNLWIGLTDQVTEGAFKWIATGLTPSYTNWYPGEPNNYLDEDYVFMLKSGFSGGNGAGESKWNDGQGTWTEFFSAPIYAVAEKTGSDSVVPEPATLSLLGLGLLGLAFKNKKTA